MNTETKQLRYFRLLEKGEIIEKEDVWRKSMSETTRAGLKHTIDSDDCMRPVQVDEWIEYAKQKPTKEDFEPTGMIQVLFKDLLYGALFSREYYACQNRTDFVCWRRITPPQQPEPKSVELVFNSGASNHPARMVRIQKIELNKDGTASLDCGDIISAESIDQFIKAREEVMDKKKGLCF